MPESPEPPTPEAEEIHSCPERMEGWGPWEVEPNLDRWIRTRWSTDVEAVQKKHAEEEAKHKPGTYYCSPDADLWRFTGLVPRTCSFCGGIHPDDAIALIGMGWTVDPTTKGYKRYLEPPKAVGGEELKWSPVPPVKLYVYHFTTEQIDRFNAILESRRVG